ncbi:hypothetical protein AAMO2058_001540200 [Amorphochlora amoebiformis]
MRFDGAPFGAALLVIVGVILLFPNPKSGYSLEMAAKSLQRVGGRELSRGLIQGSGVKAFSSVGFGGERTLLQKSVLGRNGRFKAESSRRKESEEEYEQRGLFGVPQKPGIPLHLFYGDQGVYWVPESAMTAPESEMLSDPSTVKEIARMPLLPLPQVCIPGGEEVLLVTEPKYLKMYNELLHNGSKRFAAVLTDQGRISEYGAAMDIGQIEDLSTSDEQGDIKYRVTHKVTDRIRVLRIINPKELADQENYIQVEVEILQDSDEKDDIRKWEEKRQEIYTHFRKILELQNKYDIQARFTEEAIMNIKLDRKGLWKTLNLWKQYFNRVEKQKERELQEWIEEVVREHLSRMGKSARPDEKLQVNFRELPRSVQQQITMLTKNNDRNLDMVGAGPFHLQRTMQLNSYAGRLDFFGQRVLFEMYRMMTKELEIKYREELPRYRARKKRKKNKFEIDEDEDEDDDEDDGPMGGTTALRPK